MRFLSVLFLFALLLTSCDNDNTSNDSTNVDLNIKLQYDGNPLVMYTELTYPDGKTFRITDVKGYFSEIGLNKDGTTTEIKDVAHFSLGDAHSDEAEAEAGFSYKIADTGVTDFDAITFNVGLTNAQNNTQPNDYDSSNDLSKASEYWSNWGSYVYFKIEGNIDFDGDGNYANGENIVLHLGTENALRPTTINTKTDDGKVNLILDLEKVFNNNGSIYDIQSMPTIHATVNDVVLRNIDELSTNISQAFRAE